MTDIFVLGLGALTAVTLLIVGLTHRQNDDDDAQEHDRRSS